MSAKLELRQLSRETESFRAGTISEIHLVRDEYGSLSFELSEVTFHLVATQNLLSEFEQHAV